jgi:hypothetical protein
MCNGTGEVKYYYGEGDDDYDMRPCTSCNEKGYIMVVPKGDSNHGKRVACGSCETYVDELITKEDAAGESRTWCADCWADYEALMGISFTGIFFWRYEEPVLLLGNTTF